jgi:hypothetical protein
LGKTQVIAMSVPPTKTDWPRILLDLRMVKVPTSKVAELVNRDQKTIQCLMNGVEPKHSVGEAILEIHRMYVIARRST